MAKRTWTPREVSILKKMMEEGYPKAAIAQRLGRTHGQVHDKWRTIKRKEKAEREAAKDAKDA